MKSAEIGGGGGRGEFDELKQRWKKEEEMRMMNCDKKVTMTNQKCLGRGVIEQMGETIFFKTFIKVCSILPLFYSSIVHLKKTRTTSIVLGQLCN
jgi:hypothetical protein